MKLDARPTENDHGNLRLPCSVTGPTVTGEFSNAVSAESLAEHILLRPVITASDILKLSLALPSEVPVRGSNAKQSRSVSLGLYASQGLLRVRDVSRDHPLSTKVFARFVKQICPEFSCTTLSVFTNLQASLHQDKGNDPNSRNLLFPLSSFEGGEVWYEQPGGSAPYNHKGQTLHGKVLDVSQGLCFLDAANVRHATLPWRGSRTILVGYSAVCPHDTVIPGLSMLQDAEFPLPKALRPEPAALGVLPSCGLGNNPASGSSSAPLTNEQPLFVELFAGCARLSRVCADRGFRCLAVDSPWNKHKPEFPVMVLDLADPVCQAILLKRFAEDPPAAVHCALPCGTGSRAREKPISRQARLAGAPEPKPLRNAEHILGLPGLTGRDLQRVQGSNLLCQFVIQLLAQMPPSTFISIENPKNSWVWGVLAHFVRSSRDVQLLAKWKSMCDVVFSQCMKGGRRAKLSRFRCTHDFLGAMAAECDGLHDHLPYETFRVGRRWEFSTAQEAEYPLPLCQEFSQLLSKGLSLPALPVPSQASKPPLPQPRKSRRLIPEFLAFSDAAPTDGRPFKELSSSFLGGHGRFGLYRTPLEFVDCAMQLVHPFDEQHYVPDQVKRNIFRILTEGNAAFAHQRLMLTRKLKGLRKELQYEEARFQSTLPDHVREVVKGKNIMLWAHLLKETAFEDQAVVELMQGVDLVGTPDKSPLYDWKHVPASSTAELLLESSEWRRNRLKAKDPHQGDHSMGELLWSHTLKDVEDGFLAGPFEDEDAVRKHLCCHQFVASRRFLLEQGTPEKKKHRAIDNYKEGGVNEAYSALEKLSLFDVSYILAMAAYIAKVADPIGSFEIVLCTGEVLRGCLHKDFASLPPWKGRTLDLSKAYRQVPLSSSSLPFGVVMVNDPSDGRAKYFTAQSLPFGATSSVFSFNRISRSLLHLGWHLCGLIAGCFYDDFPMLEPGVSSGLASESFEGLLSELGWRYAKDDDKAAPFAEDFDLLGVRMSVGNLLGGVVRLENKSSCLEKLKDSFLRMGLSGKTSLYELQSLQGQVNFATSFASGKSLKMLQRALSNLISRHDSIDPGELAELCQWAMKLLEHCQPRIFGCRGPTQPVLIFSDAAFENGVGTYGIVLLDPFTNLRIVGGGEIDPKLISFWRQDCPDQVIGQCEAFAVLLARHALRPQVTGRRCIYFVDNEGSREVLVKGSSRSRTLLSLGSLFFEMENTDHAITWLERVPSASNIADAPSRGLVTETAHTLSATVFDFSACAAALARSCLDVQQLPWKLLS